jgi:hypothetical protein
VTVTDDETIETMFDEVKTVSVRTVEGKRFVADGAMLAEMELQEASEALEKAERKFERIDRTAKAQHVVPDNLSEWFDALEERYQAEKRVWQLFTAGERSRRMGMLYLRFRESLFTGLPLRADA